VASPIIQDPPPQPSPVPPKSPAMNDMNDLIDTPSPTHARKPTLASPSPTHARKPTLASPINRWNHPKRVTKARPTPIVKKITEKSEKVNTLTNFFNPLVDTQDDSGHHMDDDFA
jgi:hypothetical protein